MIKCPSAFAWLGMAMLVAVLGACRPAADPAPVSAQWVKIDADGTPALVDMQRHHCVFDQRTGLMWEVKRHDSALHHPAHTFTWHSSDEQLHMSDPGLPDGGDCSVARCDTEGLAAAVNAAGLCGYRDWRVPTRAELLTLGDLSLRQTGQVIDPAFFPQLVVDEYWTIETFRLYPQSAWAVSARHGLDRADLKREPKPVRLVRRHLPAQGDEP
ncbi:MAG: DUF1566 domain-containing protein [Pseudomonadota bacterium]|nr:MAG: DUF1566 domain-containing protein [Pseudomonadota bacterium]